ncbi:hypothetical protein [Sphaerisporangium corydalis]|uniref:Uncharacterized protein n=1 Tax=Sphaerisporangium corydalis TaxID=1441875 RepID=A0ABV9ESL0_9ACTN|nr:hypothetical protein [Sphaerisporangium corydalis]
MKTTNDLRSGHDGPTATNGDGGYSPSPRPLPQLLELILVAAVTLTIGGLLLYIVVRDWGALWAVAFAIACAGIAVSLRLLGRWRSDAAAIISDPHPQDERRHLISLKAGSTANKAVLTVGSGAYVVSTLKGEGSDQLAIAFAGIVSVAVLTYVCATWWFSRRS